MMYRHRPALTVLGLCLLLWQLHADPSLPPLSLPPAQARYSVQVDDTTSKLTTVEINFPVPAWSNSLFRVFTESGQPVGADIFWAAPNTPTTLIFDSSSGAQKYNVFLGVDWPLVHLPEAHAGVWLETRAGDGQPVDNLKQMMEKWNGGAVLGRSLINGIFEGGNRFGIQKNLLLHFSGWFENTQPEHLAIMTVSTDASFLLVDGKEVTEWPGHHHFGDGMQGKYQGQIDVPAGTHCLEYYNDYTSIRDGWPVLACAAIKGGPFNNWNMLMPEAHFFKPAGTAHVIDYEAKPNNYSGPTVPPPCSFEYAVEQQSVIGPDNDSNAFITLSLTVFPSSSANTYTWTFDDGTSATGTTVSHTFLRPGNRTVQIAVKDPTQKIPGTMQQTICVSLDGNRLLRDQPHLDQGQRQTVLGYDFTKLSTSDLADCINLFSTYQDLDGLAKVLPILIPKMNDVAPEDLLAEEDAASQLNDAQPDREKLSTDLLSALIARCNAQDSSPRMKEIANESRLELAQITLPKTEQPDAAMLKSIDQTALSDFQKRNLAILRADLALAQGQVADARQQYLALCTTIYHGDERSSVRQTGKVGQARALMRQNDLRGAEDDLNQVLVWAPTAKLSSDWALARLYLYRQENQPQKAYIWGKRLLPVITDSSRSELLYQVAEMASAQNDQPLLQKCVQELVAKHPYAEETAKARAKWPAESR